MDAGVITKADVHAELGDIVSGVECGRESEDEIVIFDSTGMALQDVAAAACLYEKANQQGAGVQLSFAA
jgi:alanine dehydrogenase